MADRIQHRHIFYVEKMLQYLAPLQPKDPKRNYGSLEREYIYYRDKKKCAVCGSTVAWTDVEIHHVQEHAKGGSTETQNGVLVHRACHPKGSRAAAFAENQATKAG
jgi:5-methylcytosine-specific restriction endonuclease McrA